MNLSPLIRINWSPLINPGHVRKIRETIVARFDTVGRIALNLVEFEFLNLDGLEFLDSSRRRKKDVQDSCRQFVTVGLSPQFG